MFALQVAKGARIMLRRSICTDDGLVNGAMGTIVGFDWPEGRRTEGQQPCGLHILFDDCRVGRMTRNSAEHLPTTVRPVTATFKSRNGRFRFERYQYPIVLAWAVTIYKVQGLSVDKAVIDLGSSVFAHGQAYVALSRVKSLGGVMLVGLIKSAFHKNDRAVHREYERLAGLPIV